MICPKCKTENSDESAFCNNCGTKLTNEKIDSDNNIKNRLNLFKNKRKLIFSCSIAALVIIICICLVGYFNNPFVKFKGDIRNYKSIEAMSIYNRSFKGNSNKQDKVNSFLKEEITSIEKSFSDGKTGYNDTIKKLETIRSTSLNLDDVNKSINKINKLNDSRTAFKKAEEFAKSNDYISALKEYKNVIADDEKNYDKAKEQIKNYEKKYKEQVLKTAEDSANTKDFDKAVSLLKDATSIITDDSDLNAKLAVYEKQAEDKRIAEEKAKAEKAKSEQLIVVESSKIAIESSEFKSLYPDMIQVIVKNKSDKTIKDMDIGCLAYDKNGYPLQIKLQFSITGDSYEFIGKAPDVNIIPGGTFGDKVGWKLDEAHGISTILACVKSATYYDGTTWDNPYYPYWIEQFKEKPLKK